MKQWIVNLNNNMCAKAKKEEGVTLIELLAVIVILAVIAVVAVPVVTGSITKSKESVTQQNMAIIVDALNRYAQDNSGKFPTQTTLGDIMVSGAAGSALTNATTPYLQSIPKDGWGNNYSYGSSNGSTFLLETNSAPGQTPESWWVTSNMANPTDNGTEPTTY